MVRMELIDNQIPVFGQAAESIAKADDPHRVMPDGRLADASGGPLDDSITHSPTSFARRSQCDWEAVWSGCHQFDGDAIRIAELK